MAYKITDTNTGEQHWFDSCDLDCIKYAFGFDADEDASSVCDSLALALQRHESTYGLEQYLGVEVEEVNE